MKVFVVLKEVWHENLVKYSDGSSKMTNWKKAEVGAVRLSRQECHDMLISEGWQVANIEWFNSDYSRRSTIEEKFKWDEADIIEREVPDDQGSLARPLTGPTE